MEALRQAAVRLERYSRARDYAGPDPYDGLLSPLARYLPDRPRVRQAWVQAVKRSPMDLRPLLRIPPVRMTKTLALFASGYARSDDPEWCDRGRQLAEEILARRGTDAWGYEFDVQTRWGFYPAGQPNIIATAFAVEALHDHGLVDRVADPVRSWLEREMIAPDGTFRYVPGNDRLIHNANLLGARAYTRVGGKADLVTTATKATVAAQRPDGLWPYGEGHGLEWVDGFHTVYVLDCLADLALPAAETALHAGIQAWRERLFQPDGRPRYLADEEAKIDLHNHATMAYGLARLTPGQASPHWVTDWLLPYQDASGAFRQPHRPAYARWNCGHAFRARAAWTAS